jgi:Predicted alternative thymidylate synthase
MIIENNPYEVEVVQDSISQEGIRLPSVRLKYWRPIHSEVMTHRVFSRLARSSRAVPTITLLNEDPFMPDFKQNRPGMQATEEMSEHARKELEQTWYDLARYTQQEVARMHDLGGHKQWVNRPLEWFGFIHVLITSTDWENFFVLRRSRFAQPELEIIANLVHEALAKSTPKLLKPGEWHLPFVSDELLDQCGIEVARKVSAARCARISYKTFDGSDPTDLDREIDRYRRLIQETPPHASPVEHQATPDEWLPKVNFGEGAWNTPHLHGNFRGWVQHRKLIPGEAALDVR